jgi:hypothetical protein
MSGCNRRLDNTALRGASLFILVTKYYYYGKTKENETIRAGHVTHVGEINMHIPC